MRLAMVFRTLAVVAFVALVLVACFDPSALAAVRHRASQNAVSLALGLIAAAFGAKLTLAVPVFGAKAHITAPLLLTLLAPYLLRAPLVKTGASKTFALLRRAYAPVARPAKPENPALASGVPAALPARIASALVAAARARR